jgi:hypothetical protein
MKPIIILTSTVHVKLNKNCIFQVSKDERIQTYLNSVLQWLNNTNLDIVLVENSDYNFDELSYEKEHFKNRFEVITFNENNLDEAKYLENNDSKGASEIFSINYAFKNSKLIKENCFIIKISGRFFIPELEKFLLDYDLDTYDCLSQCDRDRCEMVGSHYRNFSYIFNINLINQNNEYEGHIESIWKIRTLSFNNNLICRNFPITPTRRGGIDGFFDNI